MQLIQVEPSSVTGRSGGLIVAASPPAAGHSIAEVVGKVGKLMVVVRWRYSDERRRRGAAAPWSVGMAGCFFVGSLEKHPLARSKFGRRVKRYDGFTNSYVTPSMTASAPRRKKDVGREKVRLAPVMPKRPGSWPNEKVRLA